MSCPNPLQDVLRLKLFSRKLFKLGELDVLYASEGVFVFTRKLDTQLALVAINSGEEDCELDLMTEPNLLLSGQLEKGTLFSNSDGLMRMSLKGMSSHLYLNSSP